MEIIYPLDIIAGETVDNLNNASIVLKIIYKNSEALFTGDIEKEVEGVLLANSAGLKAQILKVAHHGSNTSSQFEFIEQIDPDFAIASLGKNNKFGHPSRRVEKRFEQKNIEFLRTDLKGDIRFKSDGESWTLLE